MVKTRSSTRLSAGGGGGGEEDQGTANESDDQDVILIKDKTSRKSSRPPNSNSTSTKAKEKSTQNKKRKYGSSGNKNDGTNRVNGTILAYFKSESTKSSSNPSPEEDVPEKEPKKLKIDTKTRQFLESGIPEVVAKAQKSVEMKKIESDFLSLVEFFPKFQATQPNPADTVTTDLSGNVDTFKHPLGFARMKEVDADGDWDCENSSSSSSLSSFFRGLVEREGGEARVLSPRHQSLICCRPISNLLLSDEDLGISNVNSVPWIEDCRVGIEGLKDLCCDKEALNKLTFWLKQWKTDIKDDGGASRKIDLKKKRRDAEDNFITSDEDGDDLKKKSVILTGPSGCGKTSAVYAAAKHYGFHVVEVNFSSRRPGKDVLQKVEEAVLSHRLKSGKNCLLLFEDIDLVDQKEDEGFHSAVSRLITNAVRPIVMTTSYLGQLLLDPKLEKKEPLVIQFSLPSSSQIVRKVVCPMIFSRASVLNLRDQEEVDEQEGNVQLSSKLTRLLDSICRHGRNDVRQIINQIQFIFTFSSSYNSVTASHTHQHSIQSDLFLDLGFTRPSDDSLLGIATNVNNNNSEDDEDDMGLSAKARSKLCLVKLNSISEMLSFVCDLDVTKSTSTIKGAYFENVSGEISNHGSALKCNYSDPNFCTAFSNCTKAGVREQVAESLVIDNDKELKTMSKGRKLFDEIGDYCDNIYSDGGWESASYVRSIIKRNVTDSIGRLAKRNGRVTSYFNRLDRSFTTRICESFGYNEELAVAKHISEIS